MSERLEWIVKQFKMTWANHRVAVDGDSQFIARTLNKYNNCPVAHCPQMHLEVQIKWATKASQDDHHVQLPYAPERLKQTEKPSWDSYRLYRSAHVEFDIKLESRTEYDASTLSVHPAILLYGPTSRFMSHVGTMLAEVTRPTRRGTYYNAVPPIIKPTLGQHLFKLNVEVQFPGLAILYFNSNERMLGLRFGGM